MELVEAKEAVGEDNGILGGFWRGLDWVFLVGGCDGWGHTVFGADVGIVILYCGTEV